MAYSDVNTLNLTGRLVETPVLKKDANGNSYTRVILESTYTNRDKEEVVQIPVLFFGRQSELLARFGRRNKALLVIGRIKPAENDSDSLEMICRDFKFGYAADEQTLSDSSVSQESHM